MDSRYAFQFDFHDIWPLLPFTESTIGPNKLQILYGWILHVMPNSEEYGTSSHIVNDLDCSHQTSQYLSFLC